MSFRNLEQQQAAVIAAQVENAKRQTIAEVYAEHQDFVRCQANDGLILDSIRRWTDYSPDVLPTKAIFDLAIEENPEELKSFLRQSLVVAKEKIVDEYIELLAAHSRQDRYSLESERKRLTHLSLEQVRVKLDELKRRQGMSSQSVASLKTFVSNAHRDVRPFPGWPTLPPTMWNGTSHVKVDAAYLNNLIQTDTWQFKKLVRLYGSAQIDRARGIK